MKNMKYQLRKVNDFKAGEQYQNMEGVKHIDGRNKTRPGRMPEQEYQGVSQDLRQVRTRSGDTVVCSSLALCYRCHLHLYHNCLRFQWFDNIFTT